ncbi:MAG TPA: hypothetical protein VGE69_16600 [Pseudomonadales bacterium]
MRSRLVRVAVFVGAVILLRQGIVLVDVHVGIRSEQRAAIEQHGVDPRALFYAESSVALAAEKEFRRKLE